MQKEDYFNGEYKQEISDWVNTLLVLVQKAMNNDESDLGAIYYMEQLYEKTYYNIKEQ